MGADYPKRMVSSAADGSERVSVEFKGNVSVADGAIYIHGDRSAWSYGVAGAERLAEGLQDALRWLKGGAVEVELSQDQGEALSAAIDLVDAPPPPEQRWGVEISTGHQVTWDPQVDPSDWRSTFDDKRVFNGASVIELTGCESVAITRLTLTRAIQFLAEDHEVEVVHSSKSRLVVKMRLENNTFVEFTEGAVICRLARSVDTKTLYQYREYFAMTGYGRFVARWRAGKYVSTWGGAALQSWQP